MAGQIHVALYEGPKAAPPSPPLAPPPSPPLAPPPQKLGATGVPPPLTDPSRDDPFEEKKKELETKVTIGPEKTEDEWKADLEKKTKETHERAGESILDAITEMPQFKQASENLGRLADTLPVPVQVAPIPILVPLFLELRKREEDSPVSKTPTIKLSTGKLKKSLLTGGLDTDVQFTYKGPVGSPTEIAANFTLRKSAYPSALPEGVAINIALTAKFPDRGKPGGEENQPKSQSVEFTLTIPLPGEPKAKK